jgi:uncharacterized membrane protein (DUF485 family)
MAWAIPMILGLGAALLMVPVVLHFLMQPKPKRVDLPTLRFLQERQHSTRSRMRLRHLMLLLLRCLLIALGALALAGPAVASRNYGNWLTVGGIGAIGLLVAGWLLATLFSRRSNGALTWALAAVLVGLLGYGGWSALNLFGSEESVGLGDVQAPVAAVVLIDTSPRMSYRQNNLTRLQKAQEIASWLVNQFPDNSRVCVLATDNDEPFFSVDPAAAVRRIGKLGISYVSAGIPETLDNGIRLLEKSDQTRKEIYLLTDLTAASWQGKASGTLQRRLNRLSAGNVIVVDVGSADVENFSLAPVELSAVEITESGGLVVSTDLQRQGAAAQRTVSFAIEQPDFSRPVIRDGRAVYSDDFWQQQSTVDVRENGVARVEFRFQQQLQPGTYHGQLEIVGSDSLSLDDVRYFSFQVSPQWKALVVSPQGVSSTNLISTIAPTRLVELGTARYDCEEIDFQQFEARGNESDGSYAAIFLLDPPPLTDSTWERLTEYAKAGGGVVMFLGHNCASGPEAHSTFQNDLANRAMGFSLTRIWRSAEDAFLSPSENDLAHPLFRSFRQIDAGIPWSRFPVRRHWGSEPLDAGQLESADRETPAVASVLLRYSNREAAVWEHRIGAGRFLTMTTPISEPSWSENRTIWNELFLGKPLPAWLLVRAIAQHVVAGDADSLNIQVGQLASFENDLRTWPESYRVFTPAEDQSPATIHAVDGQIRYRFTDMPGHYRLKGQLDGPVLRGFSTSLDSAATDLTRLEPNRLDTVFGAERYEIVQQKEEIQRQQGTNRRGKELYPLLMLMLLVAMTVENLISNQFYRSS